MNKHCIMKLLLPLLCLFVLISCDKNDDNNSGPGNKELLTASVWVFDYGGLDANKDGTPEVPFSTLGVGQCLLDNKGTFNADNTGVNDEGLTKCDPMLPQSTNFTWSFANNETNLNIIGSGFFGLSGQFKILALTSTQLGLSKDTTIAPFGSVALVAYLKH
jgi:hypothetical protein